MVCSALSATAFIHLRLEIEALRRDDVCADRDHASAESTRRAGVYLPSVINRLPLPRTFHRPLILLSGCQLLTRQVVKNCLQDNEDQRSESNPAVHFPFALSPSSTRRRMASERLGCSSC